MAQDDGFKAKLEAKKKASVAQLLFKAARLLNEMGVARVQAQGVTGFRLSHTTILPHLELEGIRLTELARRAGITKQATGEIVADLVNLGILTLEPDPEDGRAKLVRFTEKGRLGLLQGLRALGEIQDEMKAALGERDVAKLHRILIDLVDWLESK